MGFRSWISGNKRKITDPGFFEPGTVGGGWGDYLKKLYSTDTENTNVFRSQSGALKDALGQEANAQGEQFALGASSGGFYDSGARLSGLTEINRNKMASYSQGLAAILTNLEHEKMSAAFPFLQAEQQNWNAYQNAQYQQDELQTQRKKQIAQTVSSIFGSASGGGGAGSMGNSSGGYSQ